MAEAEKRAGPVLARREFLRRTALGGVGLFTFTISGRQVHATPEQARAAGAELRFLTSAEATVLERLGDAFVPGSAAAGLAHYVDHQLSVPPAQSMLMAKYVGVAPPFGDFYRASLSAAHTALHGAKLPADAEADNVHALAAAMGRGEVPGWQGPAPGFAYFVLRSDAIDVVYGTPEGFKRLGVPYMEHIYPPTRWGE